MLSFLGKLGKGYATLTGIVAAVSGVVGGLASGNGATLQKCAEELLKQPPQAALLVGALLVAFGVGRKAGWIASK